MSGRGFSRRALLGRLGALAALRAATGAAATPCARAAFVLVHGGWHGGWCYGRVADILRQRGHLVFAPTLTGLGERSHLSRDRIVDCSVHVQDVLNVIHWEQLQQVVLCGHSYGGYVIGAVADAIPERVCATVYLDAPIPRDGRSILDGLPPAQVADLIKQASMQGDYALPPVPASSFGVNAADAAMVDALCTPHPMATLLERLKLSGRYLDVPRKSFVLATGWKGDPSIRRSYEWARQQSGWRTQEIDCGHDVMLDAPRQLADILQRSL